MTTISEVQEIIHSVYEKYRGLEDGETMRLYNGSHFMQWLSS